MKTLNDIKEYAISKGITGHQLERLIDEVESDGNGNVTEQIYDETCFGIDCETEEN